MSWPDVAHGHIWGYTAGALIILIVVIGMWLEKRTCSICGQRFIPLPYETPADPPFFGAVAGRHCAACEGWLRGE